MKLFHSSLYHDKSVEEQQQFKRKPGRPRQDRISCRVGLKETHCDWKFAVYSLTCMIFLKEYKHNPTTDQGTSLRALCRHSEKEKRLAVGRARTLFSLGRRLCKERDTIFRCPYSGVWRKRRSQESKRSHWNQGSWTEINRNGGWQLDRTMKTIFLTHKLTTHTFVSHMHKLHAATLVSIFTPFTATPCNYHI